MDHAVDLIGNGLCEFIIVPDVVFIDRDIHTAKVGRPGRTASGQSCLCVLYLRDFPAIRADRGSCAGVQINTRLFHIKNYRRNHGFL